MYLKLHLFRVVTLTLIFTGISYLSTAQLLEQGKGRLKTVRGEKPGFLFFQRKVKSVDPDKSKRFQDKGVAHPKSELPANYNRKTKPVKIRTTRPVSYNKKDRFVAPRTSTPVSYNKKDKFPAPRTSTPVSYNKKDKFPPPRTSTPVSYNKKDKFPPPRTSTPVSYNKKDRFPAPRMSSPVSYNKKEVRVKTRYSKPQKETYFNIWWTTQLRIKSRTKPPSDPSRLYNRSKISLQGEFQKRKISVSGPMSYKVNSRLKDQLRPTNEYTNRYKGDIKRDRVPILQLKYRFGQWEMSSYRGHHVAWNKRAKKSNDQFNSLTVHKFKGDVTVPNKWMGNLLDKMNHWEQSRFQGRSVGRNEYGNTVYFRRKSLNVSNFEGDIKIKKPKGGDMHPSVAYISGKKYSSTKWKERWRKLNISWVRLNPGKEVPDGAKVKYKEKYDKEERDIWTY